MEWKLKTFQDLTIEQFYEIARLRINIFIVEQNCPYAELDGKDALALNFLPLQMICH